ncbi:hypothetical protein BDN71DRAFT_1430572 [Pleurotus eryngii]|uniref:Uncharacterized protein n=1 Tax=Pleurotus eryngii TaxID=5323 RepID=A0A9P6A1C8_PLEER|nr:hypothetical protein BDN71DRAFT_1430572 [Pleurotus eryngii]
MGHSHPTLYYTPEEKLIANCAKSKQSYYKQPKLYRTLEEKATANCTKSKCSYNGCSERAATKLISTPALGKALKHLYQNYMVSHCKDKLSNTTIHLEGLQNITNHCLDGILQLAGVGIELGMVQTLGYAVAKVLAWLENIMCCVMCGYSEVIEMHTMHQLLYQGA